MQSRNIKIINKLGMHARPAALLTKTANLFGCKITITKNGKTIDAKSILSVMTLAAKCGDEITITAEGAGEDTAIDSLVSLIDSRFGEKE